MSHEIRTPLNGVIGMLRFALRDEQLSTETRHKVRLALSSGESLLTIINDILDFSKIEAGKLEFEEIEFDLRSILEATLDIVAEKASYKKLELVCLVDAGVPDRVRGDPGRLRQILLNLLDNALKFTEEGRILVRAETLAASHIRISVRDTGIGMDEAARGRIFRAFAQADGSVSRKFGGTGLGLAISRRLAGVDGRRLRRRQHARHRQHLLVHGAIAPPRGNGGFARGTAGQGRRPAPPRA